MAVTGQTPDVTIIVPLPSGGQAFGFEQALASVVPWTVIVGTGDSLAEAMAAGLASATTEYVAFLGSDDVVTSDGIGELVESLDARPDVVYTDEILGGATFFKPSFSPERLRSQFYVGNLTLYRRELLLSIGGISLDVAGAERYDLALRATTAAGTVAHLPVAAVRSAAMTIESAWSIDETARLASTRTVLERHLAATGGGTVGRVSADGIHATSRAVIGEPLVSIVIPTRGTRAEVRGVDRCMVVEAIRGIVEKSTYTNVEFVVVIDDVAPQEVRDELVAIAGDRMRFVDWDQPFSFSGKMNLGVVHARGEFVLLLNDDVELITPGWIEPMLALAQRQGAGLVGAMLYFDDDTIQHAGHAYYQLDVTHVGLHSARGAVGPFGGFALEREAAGVTCACALMTRELFFEAGGFSTLLPGNFNDVDLCMKVMRLGYQSYFTPHAELYHFESRSRDPRVATSEVRTAWGRWEHLFWDSPLWPTDPHELFSAPTPGAPSA